jgi:hypothetical protein
MKKTLAILAAAAMAVSTFGVSTVPASAQWFGFSAGGPGGSVSVNAGAPRRGFYSNNGAWFYNGYQGQRQRRAGWRYHNGWWFPPAAFIAGAIGLGIANSIANSARNNSNWTAHVSWCSNRYRSYDANSNTFQPYGNVPRQECVSPYS